MAHDERLRNVNLATENDELKLEIARLKKALQERDDKIKTIQDRSKKLQELRVAAFCVC